MARRSTSYSVYDSKGRLLGGGKNVDRDTAVKVKDRAVQSGMHDVQMIRRGQDGKEPGPRVLDA
jgi:hypothetical protein